MLCVTPGNSAVPSAVSQPLCSCSCHCGVSGAAGHNTRPGARIWGRLALRHLDKCFVAGEWVLHSCCSPPLYLPSTPVPPCLLSPSLVTPTEEVLQETCCYQESHKGHEGPVSCLPHRWEYPLAPAGGQQPWSFLISGSWRISPFRGRTELCELASSAAFRGVGKSRFHSGRPLAQRSLLGPGGHYTSPKACAIHRGSSLL